jgi:hypothetical protein
MAYAATVSVPTIKVIAGRNHFRWTISEAEAASGSEFKISDAPPTGTLILYQSTLTAGTGTTINPIVGRVASFTANTQNHMGTNSSTSVHINDGSNLRYAGLVAGEIFIRSTVNSAVADHTILTEIEIIEGII